MVHVVRALTLHYFHFTAGSQNDFPVNLQLTFFNVVQKQSDYITKMKCVLKFQRAGSCLLSVQRVEGSKRHGKVSLLWC